MRISDSSRRWLFRVVAGAALLATRPSFASEEFPAALAAAAGMSCTPSCVVCHGEDPGTAATFTRRKLGATLVTYNGNFVAPHDTAALTANYNAYKATPDGAAVDALLKEGIDPETKAELCRGGPTYGCGAHVVSKPPVSGDLSVLAFVAGAMALGAVARRARSRRG